MDRNVQGGSLESLMMAVFSFEDESYNLRDRRWK